MKTKIVYADMIQAVWKGFKSQCWLLMGLLIGFTIIYSFLLLFATPAKGEPMSISGIAVYAIGFLLVCLFMLGYLRNCLQTLDGEEPQFSAYGQVLRKLFSFIPAYLFFVLIMIVGCTFFFFPGIYLFLRFQFFYTLMVDEDAGMIEAFKRSLNITKGHTMQLFIWMLFQILILFIGLMAFGIGIFAAVPVLLLMYASIYRKLTAPASL